MMQLFLTVFLALLLCSCSSRRQTQSMQSDMARVEATSLRSQDSASQILTALSSSTDINLEGVTVEFFPPDSLHPHIRDLPKSIHVEKMNVAKKDNATKSSTTDVTTKQTENLIVDASSESSLDKHSEADAFSPPGWTLFFSSLIIISCVCTFIYWKFFR